MFLNYVHTIALQYTGKILNAIRNVPRVHAFPSFPPHISVHNDLSPQNLIWLHVLCCSLWSMLSIYVLRSTELVYHHKQGSRVTEAANKHYM